MDLSGTWGLRLDGGKTGERELYEDTMELPGTTSHARKGETNDEVRIDCLTDEYKFEGWAWFRREVDIPAELAGKTAMLYLERTRVTTVWVDGAEVGSRNSLSTPHLYDLTGLLGPGKHTLTIRVDNTDYPTKGGHLTSADTQTNWNGITGRIQLRFFGAAYVDGLRTYPNVAEKTITVKARIVGCGARSLAISAAGFNGHEHVVAERVYELSGRSVEATFALGEDARLWSEADPCLYRLTAELRGADGETLDTLETTVGLREFKAAGDKFTINGRPTFLRGKHDGMIFPLTGFAPTTTEEWLRVLGIAKSYGVNHYRFHTCCPPEAAFEAADRLGVYMEPELPFWGTVTDETYENHNPSEQEYLIREGYLMLEAFGNHPSFVMMSLGNELWGSHSRIDGILRAYKEFDDRPLYTQGSNNFQFAPVILPHEDFFCGVRFSRDRLFRGSYAMCDAPQGHVQTDRPGTRVDYDEHIRPSVGGAGRTGPRHSGTVQIQYGTGTRTVKAESSEEPLVPRVPVISHEIGQYATYPNFAEIEKYTGSLKARNFEAFRERLEAKGLGQLAERYFESSGRLAVACYKEELEAAFRSRELAGFHVLDLQDFSGQGTALVGILDAFMDSKGLVTPEEWRTFCSDAVLLARFDKYNYASGERFDARAELAYFREAPLTSVELRWEARTEAGAVLAGGQTGIADAEGGPYVDIADLSFVWPSVESMTKVEFALEIAGTDIRNNYELWLYPPQEAANGSEALWADELTDDVLARLDRGENVLLLPKPERASRSIEGTYCTDFWCYPMFRSISESMGRQVPVGTMGLLIENEHPSLADFPSETHSTYPWWSLVAHSRSFILDDLPAIEPIVRTIDNFERNHKLGFLFECRVGNGNLLVCALDAEKVAETPEGKQFLRSLSRYAGSERFNPQAEVSAEDLRKLLQ